MHSPDANGTAEKMRKKYLGEDICNFVLISLVEAGMSASHIRNRSPDFNCLIAITETNVILLISC